MIVHLWKINIQAQYGPNLSKNSQISTPPIPFEQEKPRRGRRWDDDENNND